MKLLLLALPFAFPLLLAAQAQPTGACPFIGFASDGSAQPVMAVVNTPNRAHTWMLCDSPKGCIAYSALPGAPVQVYRTEGAWTCGYSADRRGAGPAWFRTADLRPVPFSITPARSAWFGRWQGGEDRVVLSPGTTPGTVQLRGTAVWHGLNGNEHFGDTAAEAVPTGNHLHLVQDGCTIDLTLAGPYVLAQDNEGCGGLNARFMGIWQRSVKARR